MVYARVTNSYMSASVFENTNANQARLVELQTQLATGKRVGKPSDDAVVVPSILNTQNFLAKLEVYDKNITHSMGELDVAESTLDSLVGNLQRVHELTNQASNELNSPSELKIIANEIDEIIRNVVNLANTSYNGKYIFSGNNVATPTYAVNGDDITYQGTLPTEDYQFEVQVKENLKVAINEAGVNIFGEYYQTAGMATPADPTDDVFYSNGIIGHLKELTVDLRTDPPDYNLIRGKLDVFDEDIQQTLFYQANYGNLINTLENTRNQLEKEEINAVDYKSTLEDIDLLKVSSDIQFQEIALQASLNAAARVIQPTMLNFLG